MKAIALLAVLTLFSLVGCTAEPEKPVTAGSNRVIRSMRGSTHSLSSRSKGSNAKRGEDGGKVTSGARAVLDEAIAAAKASEKNLFVHFGAPWAVWCGKLEKFLDENMELFEADFHFVKIDTEEMEGGSYIYDKYLDGRDGGFPWIVILDGDGKELVTSVGSDGKNISCPREDHEIEHFIAMIKATSNASEEQLESLLGKMKEYAETLEE